MNTARDLAIAGYRLTEQLYSGSRTAVYRAVQEREQRTVIIKILHKEYPSFSELLQFRNQYTITQNLKIPGIVAPDCLTPYGNSYALIMEDFGGVSLRDYCQHHSLSLADFLAIALQLVDILQDLYQHRVIHKDIKPANILIHPESKQIRLIDFSIASLLPKEMEEVKHPNVLEGTLAYLAPEQTGRMNRGVDYRTDFYALGVTFFELLTRQLPFQTNDPMELVHCHLAKSPPSVSRLQPEVPAVIGRIIAKLMAKNAEDRYQSALGLKYDLEMCLGQLTTTDTILSFEIGTRDVSDRFNLPEKLYGREQAVAALLAAFDRIAVPQLHPAHQNVSELMLVTGFSGIGKTVVVREIHKPIVHQRGYFIQGKFDQFNRNSPFSAFVQAFQDLIGQLLSESDLQLQAWKADILDALGDNGKVITDVIPELEQIIGVQPPVPELPGTAAQNRFNLLLQKFIQVFTTPAHPLVIFLDDLQWADSASLNLLQRLIAESETGYLLVIGAYRDNEVFAAHPLMVTLDAIDKAGSVVNTLSLQALSSHSLNQLVADTLNCSAAVAHPLTDLIYQKTAGNPFFAAQFLKALYQDQLIAFDHQAKHWQCDIGQVRKSALTTDVVEFMATQLQKLSATTQTMLQLAACIGNQFDLATLAIVSEQTEAAAANALWEALQEGLILPQSEVYKFYLNASPANQATNQATTNQTAIYKFFHDRVQQAAYSLIPDDDKPAIHLKIGRLLLDHIPDVEREESIFDLVNQCNLGLQLLSQESELIHLAQLNLMAGRKAKDATAYAGAMQYLNVGLGVLPEDSWQRYYDLTLALYETAMEATYLNNQMDEMERFAAVILQNTKTLCDRVKVFELKIQALTSTNQHHQAIELGIRVLAQLNIHLPLSPTLEDIQHQITITRSRLAHKRDQELLNLPRITDPLKLAAQRVLFSIVPATHQAAPLLFPLITCEEVNLAVQSGNSPFSAVAYADYAVILNGGFGSSEEVDQWGRLAIEVAEHLKAKEVKSAILCKVGAFAIYCKQHLNQSLRLLREGYQSGLDHGDLPHASYCAMFGSQYSLLSGCDLTTLVNDLERFCQVLSQMKQTAILSALQIVRQTALKFIGETEHLLSLQHQADNDDEQVLASYQTANNRMGVYFIYFHKLLLSYFLGDYDRAVDYAKSAAAYLDGVTGLFCTPAFYFYASLAQLAQHRQEPLTRHPDSWLNVTANQDKLLPWATSSPMNCQHKFDLVEAERYQVLGQPIHAIDLYDRAIAGAKTNGYRQEEALANELAAKFYLAWGKEKVAAGYMQEAYYGYVRWGAKAKTDELESRYPHLLRPILHQTNQPLTVLETLATIAAPSLSSIHRGQSSSGASMNTVIDFAALVQVAQALSSTIQLDELLQTLAQTMLENSGADHCALILRQGETWQVRVLADLQQTILQTTPLENNSIVPVKLIQYVKNTLETVVTDDLKTTLPGVVDQYCEQYQPQSLLCLPIRNQGSLVGILYLENRMVRGVFTRDRLLVLNFLCNQAAIALENARLYSQVQQALNDLQKAQLQMIQGEKMSALGNLVAGVAHEINNPVGCILGNVGAVKDYMTDLLGLIDLYSQKFPQPGAEIEAELAAIDLDYVRDDLPKLMRAMRDGGDRIKSISTSLRTFSRADSDQKQTFNLHEGIDSTVLILRHRLKANSQRPAIEVITDYGNLPAIGCFPGQLNQVFMNILANGIDALEEAMQGDSGRDRSPQIKIKTTVAANHVKITIADNGPGMTAEVKERIFDHLFTTKGVGKGTGLGLAIARQIVVEKHGGTIEVKSILGEGTEFEITLPHV